MFHKLSSLQQEFIFSVLRLGVQTQPQYWWVLQRLKENLLPDSILVSGNNQQCLTSLDLWCCWSVAKSCPTLCDPMDCSTPGFPVLHYLWSLLQLMSIESGMPSNHLILCHPLLLPSIFFIWYLPNWHQKTGKKETSCPPPMR